MSLANTEIRVKLRYPNTVITPLPPGIITANTINVGNNITVGNSTVNSSINSTAFSGTANNATNLGGQPASYYTNATNLTTGTVDPARLPQTVAYTNATNIFSTLQTFNSNVFVNTSVISIGDTSVNTTINSTSFSGVSNDALNLGGQPASYYTNATNIITGTLSLDRISAAGSNTEIQFNDSGSFSSSGNLSFDKTSSKITVGNSTVNTVVNSSAITLRSLIANGSVGVSGDVLYSNGAGLYWAVPTGGGGGLLAGNGLTSNLTHYLVLANNGIVVNSTGTFVNSSYIATLTANNSTNFNGQPASYYANATNITTGTLPFAQLPANIVFWSNTNVFTAIQTFNANLFGNSITISVGNSTSNVTTNTTQIVIGNSTINSSINSTAFSGTANNALNLGGLSSSQYALLAGPSFTGNVSVGGDLSVGGNLSITGSVVSLQGNVITFTDNMLYLNQGILATVTNVVGNGTVAIFTANNNFQIGWDVFVSAVNPSGYNGTYQNIIAANATHFEVSSAVTASYVSGGTARGKTDQNPDLGIAAGYNDGTYHHTGIFRDASDGYWKVFDGYTPEPDANVYIDTSNLSFNIASFWAGSSRFGNTTVYSTINSSAFSGTANNTTYLNGQLASYYTNATNIDAGTLAFNRLPANVVFWSNTNVFTAIQTFNANLFVNTSVLSIGNTTANVFANTTHVVVGNSSINVSINSTAFSGTANNATNLNGVAAASYVNTTGSYVITGVHTHNANLFMNTSVLSVGNSTSNVTTNTTHLVIGNSTVNVSINSTSFSGTSDNALNLGGLAAIGYVNTTGSYTITGVHTHNANLFVNTSTLSIGNTTSNVSVNTTIITVGNSTVNSSINSTAFSGTANNATNLGGQAASYYTNATNLATGTVPTARLASGTANSSTFLRGDQTWATPAGGGSGSPGGSTSDIQFNDAGNFAGNSNFTYDSSAIRLTVGNSSINTQINSTSVVVKSIVANGGLGSSGQVLTSNSTGIYWSTVSGGGGGGEVVTSVNTNTSMSSPTTFYLASGTITLTLPTAVGNSGLKFQVKNVGTGEITIDTTSSQTIDSNINMILTEQNSVIGVISDGSNWSIF